jgi:hypothetical protein
MFQLWDPNWIGTCFAVFICESANAGCWPGVVPCPSWDAAPSCGWSDQAIRGSFVKKLVKNPFQKNDPPIIILSPPHGLRSSENSRVFWGRVRWGLCFSGTWVTRSQNVEQSLVFWGFTKPAKYGKRLHKTPTIASKFETGACKHWWPSRPNIPCLQE